MSEIGEVEYFGNLRNFEGRFSSSRNNLSHTPLETSNVGHCSLSSSFEPEGPERVANLSRGGSLKRERGCSADLDAADEGSRELYEAVEGLTTEID